MLTRGVETTNWSHYKSCAMFIACPYCNFKCDKECGKQVCQNEPLASAPKVEVSLKLLTSLYCANKVSTAIVFAGLEPFDSLDELTEAVSAFREVTKDPIIIYTGYTKEELESGAIHDTRANQECSEKYKQIRDSGNIIIKYGRFIPDDEEHLDPILGVKLASRNQYAERYE